MEFSSPFTGLPRFTFTNLPLAELQNSANYQPPTVADTEVLLLITKLYDAAVPLPRVNRLGKIFYR